MQMDWKDQDHLMLSKSLVVFINLIRGFET